MTRIAIIVLTFVGILMAGLTLLVYENSVQNAEREFRRISEDNAKAIDARMGTYLQSLTAAAAYLRGSSEVTRAEFEHYVEDLNIDTILPGISGIGLTVPVAADRIAAFEAEMREEGFPEFKVYPETSSAESFVIKYIFPREPNRQAYGLDLTFEEGRRQAAQESRDVGEARMTPKVNLVQDEANEAGFVLLLPVRSDAMGTSPESDFVGWIFAPFVASKLLNGLTPAQSRYFDFTVYDDTQTSQAAVIYDSAPTGDLKSRFSAEMTVKQFGRTWTLQYRSTPAFDRLFQSNLPYTIALVGLLSLMTIFMWFYYQQQQAKSLAEVASLRERQIVAQEEEKLSIVQNAVTPVFILDTDDRVLFANQAALNCFGYDAGDMQTLRFSDMAEDTMGGNGQPESSHTTGRTRNGGKLVLDLQRNEWTNANGAGRVTVIARDITAEVAMQQEIMQTKTLYDLALQGSNIGVFDLNLQTGTSEVSDTWCRIMGFSKNCNSLDTQREFLARIHPEDRHILRESDAACISGKTSRSIAEYRMYFDKDTWRWMRSDAVVSYRDENGKALRLIGTQTDITDVRHARNALEASENQFRQVVTAAPIGMALIDDEAKFLGVNDALCKLCGQSEEQLLKNFRLSDMLHKEDLKVIYASVSQMMADGTEQTYMAEHRLRQTNGEDRWGLFHVSWSFDKNAGRNFFIAQIVDITEQKRVERIKDEFVATVSHELRTPLTSIKGALGLVMASGHEDRNATVNRLLEIAASNTDRLTQIVNDILDLEKIASGEITFASDTVNMLDLVNQTVEEMATFAEPHRNTLKVKAPLAPLMVVADPSRTRQVLSNLISNACKYSSDDTEVRIVAEQMDDMAIVYVINTGAGIPDAFRSRIFKAFSQADSSDTRAKGGTGLGLNISRQIVARQGGQIGFESTKDGLTVFWFTCPLSRSNVDTLPVAVPERPSVPRCRTKVLHLENDVDFADVVRSGLEPYADVIHTSTIGETRKLLGQHALDVVILDWNVPDGDASILLEDIKNYHPDVRILGLSAHADRSTDPRVENNIVKSRADLMYVVNTVIGAPARAS